MRQQKYGKKLNLIPVTIAGKAVFVTPEQLKGGWIPCHGDTFKGVKVESLSIQAIGESVVVQDSAGKKKSYSQDEFERAAVKFIEMRGGKVIPPAAAA